MGNGAGWGDRPLPPHLPEPPSHGLTFAWLQLSGKDTMKLGPDWLEMLFFLCWFCWWDLASVFLPPSWAAAIYQNCHSCSWIFCSWISDLDICLFYSKLLWLFSSAIVLLSYDRVANLEYFAGLQDQHSAVIWSPDVCHPQYGQEAF